MKRCHVAIEQKILWVPDRWLAVQQTFSQSSVIHVFKSLH